MWFKRKPKNRRLGRDFVLDVKLRSSQVKAARMRLAALSFGILFGTLFSLYVVWRAGEWALNEFIYENKAFAIHDIDMDTDGVIAVGQLRFWAGVNLGENLLALDLARVKRNLELVPVVQSASVERILPHTLRVRITEREPVAQILAARPGTNGGVEAVIFQLDAAGYVMLPLDPRQRARQPSQPPELLPFITGLNTGEVQAGRRIEAPSVLAALRLVMSFERSPMNGLADLKKIDISNMGVLVVSTGQGAEVTFGLADFDQQMRRWRQIYDAGHIKSLSLASLDLAVPDSIPVNWQESALVPPSIPKPPKPLRLKKKHV
jgi:cell division septal protein FtsQ